MPDAKPTILIIDDDPALRASIGRLVRSLELDARLFASISDFLGANLPDGPICLVLDVRLPGQSGLDFQRELSATNRQVPIIFITGHGDIPMSVQAMKGGAIEFFTKPFRDQELLEAIQLGLSRDRIKREREKALVDLRERFGSLSVREQEIMVHVAPGPPQQTDCRGYRDRRSHGEGPSQQGDAEDERSFASGVGPNG